MGLDNYTVAMVGYDISHLSGYIREIELGSEPNKRGCPKWIDGIPEYSLNYSTNTIGYEHRNRLMFGKIIWQSEDADYTEEGTGMSFDLLDLVKYRTEIWAKYKQFLFDHTKLTDREEPPFILNFISYFA